MNLALLVAVAVIQALDAPPAGGVVLGDRDFHAGAVGELFGLLHQAFAEGFFPDDDAAVQVLQGAGHDFRSGRGLAVHQDGHRKVGSQRASSGLVRLVPVRALPLGADHFLPLAHKQVDHRDGFPEQASAVAAQVHHHVLGPQRIREVEQGFADVHARCFRERVQGQIPRLVRQHALVRHVRHFHLAPRQREGHGVRESRPFHQDAHFGAGGALQKVADLVGVQSSQRTAIHFQQDVAQAQAGFCRRLTFQQVDDGGSVVSRFDARAHAPVLARLHETDVFHFGLREVPGVGVELGKHGLDAGLHQFPRGQFIHVKEVELSESRLHDFQLLRHLEVVVFGRGGGHPQDHSCWKGQPKKRATHGAGLGGWDVSSGHSLRRACVLGQLARGVTHPAAAVVERRDFLSNKDEHHSPLG